MPYHDAPSAPPTGWPPTAPAPGMSTDMQRSACLYLIEQSALEALEHCSITDIASRLDNIKAHLHSLYTPTKG